MEAVIQLPAQLPGVPSFGVSAIDFATADEYNTPNGGYGTALPLNPPGCIFETLTRIVCVRKVAGHQ